MASLAVSWWQEVPHWSPRARTEGYLRSAGLLKREQLALSGAPSYLDRGHWSEVLVLQVFDATPSSEVRPTWARLAEAFGRAVKQDPALGEAMLASFRLGGRVVARRYVRRVVEGTKPQPTPEDLKARQAQERKLATLRRYEQATAKLAEHERLLKMEQRLVAKWRGKVRRYERKGCKP